MSVTEAGVVPVYQRHRSSEDMIRSLDLGTVAAQSTRYNVECVLAPLLSVPEAGASPKALGEAFHASVY